MDAPNPKRSRKDVSSSIQNPNSLPTTTTNTPNFNQNGLLSVMSWLLSFPESLPPLSISRSIDCALDKALASVSDGLSVQNQLVERTLELQTVFLESTKRCHRKLATVHNSNSWLLPPELTVKVFSMLDTKSLMQAMACCTMFHQCTMEPLSYSHINLTTSAKTVKDKVVLTMISRAGKELRFLELGHPVRLAHSTTHLHLLTGACLAPLSSNNGLIGKCLRTLHLYNLIKRNYNSFTSALSACSNLTDLKIVGRYSRCGKLLKSLTTKPLFIEKLFLENYGFLNSSRKEALVEFLTNIIPKLTSLSLIGFRLKDTTIKTLTESSRKLKHLNLSRNSTIKGRFLRSWRSSFKDGPLETLILRDCSSLEEKEVSKFIDSICTGNFKYIRHIVVSSMVSDGGKKSQNLEFPLEKLKLKRSNVKFLANLSEDSSSEESSSEESSSDYSSSEDSTSEESSSEESSSDYSSSEESSHDEWEGEDPYIECWTAPDGSTRTKLFKHS